MTDETLASTPAQCAAAHGQTLRMPSQAYRFAAFNPRIVRMVLKGHH